MWWSSTSAVKPVQPEAFQVTDVMLAMIALHCISDMWKAYLYIRQLSVAIKSTPMPQLLAGRMSEERYEIFRRNCILSCITTIVATGGTLIVKSAKLLLGYHPLLWVMTGDFVETLYWRAVLFAAMDSAVTKLLFLPPTVILALASGDITLGSSSIVILSSVALALAAALSSAISALVLMTIVEQFGSHVLFYAPIVSNAAVAFVLALKIHFVVPLTFWAVNRFPLFLNLIQQLTDQVGYPTKRVYVDPSPANPPNAYFVGLFGAKMITITYTLMCILNPQQISAVVAHELGHWAKGHNYSSLVWSLGEVMVVSYGLFGAYDNQDIQSGFRFDPSNAPHAWISLYLWVTYSTPLVIQFMRGINSVFDRHLEFQADDFAIKRNLGEPLECALVTLAARSPVFPIVDKWYSAWFLRHPTLIERLGRNRVR